MSFVRSLFCELIKLNKLWAKQSSSCHIALNHNKEVTVYNIRPNDIVSHVIFKQIKCPVAIWHKQPQENISVRLETSIKAEQMCFEIKPSSIWQL